MAVTNSAERASSPGELVSNWQAEIENCTLWLIGLVVAHAANHLSNDFFELQEGLDTKDYPRALYAPHPVLSGLTTHRQLKTAFLTLTVVDAIIALFLTYVIGPLVLGFAAAGL